MTRQCAYRRCTASLEDRRPQCIYCCPAHKAAEHRAKAEDQRGNRPEPRKPYRNRPGRPRRANRKGQGTDLYVVRDEVELVRDLLAGKRPRSTAARDRLTEKIPRALDRIDRRAA